MEKGALIPIAVPPFELNKSKLRYKASELLDDYKSSLANNPNATIEIVCYPDNNTDKKENLKLSEERCNSLKAYFVDNGIDASRITTKPQDATDPKNPPPVEKRAKGKRYIGPSYLMVKNF
jgi:outer membrane protein OmpA-like peptidoglycan-associated protein